ncbi:hypothetical protein V2W45_1349857 [Cenococcum geophilum]
MPAHPFPNHSQAWPLAGQLSLCRWERACGYCTESPFPDFRSLHLHVLDKHAIPGWRTIVVKVEEEGEDGETNPSPTRAHTPKNPPTPLRPPRSRLPPRRTALVGGLPSAILLDELYVQLLHTAPDLAVGTEARAGETP